jgi:hypothetical protein
MNPCGKSLVLSLPLSTDECKGEIIINGWSTEKPVGACIKKENQSEPRNAASPECT